MVTLYLLLGLYAGIEAGEVPAEPTDKPGACVMTRSGPGRVTLARSGPGMATLVRSGPGAVKIRGI